MRYFELKIVKGVTIRVPRGICADKSDILLALWDGTFNNKSGGTGDIVQYARERGKKIVHFLCDRESSTTSIPSTLSLTHLML